MATVIARSEADDMPNSGITEVPIMVISLVPSLIGQIRTLSVSDAVSEQATLFPFSCTTSCPILASITRFGMWFFSITEPLCNLVVSTPIVIELSSLETWKVSYLTRFVSGPVTLISLSKTGMICIFPAITWN